MMDETMEIDPTVFLNYGMAGLILLVFYLLFRNELAKLNESIDNLRITQEKLVTLLDLLLKKLMGEEK
jgi:hypothetical protein